jgi:hypothetical protein
MDDLQLRDEAVRDRVRAAQEFLDPRRFNQLPTSPLSVLQPANRPQWIPLLLVVTDQILY